MPDLDIQYVNVCATNSLKEAVPSSKGTDVYEVFVHHDESMDNCTCPGFMYRGKCKHVTALREKLCGWSAFTHEEQQTPQQEMEAICPKCGGDTTVIRMGV